MAKNERDSDDAHGEPCEDVRCCCGRLVARLLPTGVELKCGRCHRIVLIPVVEGFDQDEPSGSPR